MQPKEWVMFRDTSENHKIREPYGPDSPDHSESNDRPWSGSGGSTALAKSEPRGFERQPQAGPGEQITILPKEVAPASRRRIRRLPVIALAAALILGGGGWYGYQWLTVGRFIVSTDDAYVRAHNTTLAAKVPGYVAAIEVEDNSIVHAGDVIARIDDGDYQLAVNSARDKVATQTATVDRLGRQIVAQGASVDQAKAQIVSAEAA